MKILITGSNGFIGQNLIAELKNRNYEDLLLVDKETREEDLEKYCSQADFIYHLAGVNRPENIVEFQEGNVDFTDKMLGYLKTYKNEAPIVLSSSIQAELDNPYGVSKKMGEELLFSFGESNGSKVIVYRFPNVFGKWCRPNYNSAIATFCYNISHGKDIQVNDSNVIMNLVYIDDVVSELINGLDGKEFSNGKYCSVNVVYTQKLGWIADTIKSFSESRINKVIPNMGDDLTKKLYSTYLSYLDEKDFSYLLKMNVDDRGSFTEFIKTKDAGQVSINISKPGIVKGQHWHHTKNEKFLVVSGQGVIRFRKIGSDEVIEYFVSGEKLEVVDVPVGYTHNIENNSEKEMVTVMWANEPFDPENPDTFYLEV
ncbi:capsular polysaccharide biosynthesis protein CapF [uncultured Vagococcus sp.]|uniref:capsular polysaccharide biosynthesis protein CapF n=1 Tax=uncultured Vagococcus sp. TaxID=189676 RepID=UPI0028D2D1A2|nr:capsular polysaccharide biosynthesis protein CapF [uncultured Vagococcus sp.]